MKDSTGLKLEIGQTVIVPDPNDSDIHNYSFAGEVKAFRGDYVVVVDGEGDCFEIEPERLEIQDEIF